MEMPSYEANTYSVQPTEVHFSEGNQQKLNEELREAIDESFLFADHSQSLNTVEPIELDTPTTRNETYDMLTLGIPYDRLHVDAVIDHDGDPSLRSLKVKLYRNDWGMTAYTTISAYESDDAVEDEDVINIDEPAFFITSPQDLKTGKRELIPLDYRTCRELLNHIVSLANPIAALTIEDRNILECMEALMAVSEETSIGREAKYQFQQNENEVIEVHTRDKMLQYPLGEPRHTYHEAIIKRIRSFGRAGSLTTILDMSSSLDEVEATVAKDYSYADYALEEIMEQISDVTEAGKMISSNAPDEFGRQLIDNVYLLQTTSLQHEGIDRIDI